MLFRSPGYETVLLESLTPLASAPTPVSASSPRPHTRTDLRVGPWPNETSGCTNPSIPLKPVSFWRTKGGLLAILVVAIIIVGAVIGGAVGGSTGTHHNKSTVVTSVHSIVSGEPATGAAATTSLGSSGGVPDSNGATGASRHSALFPSSTVLGESTPVVTGGRGLARTYG